MDRAEARMLAEEITRAQRGGGGGGGRGGGGGAGLVDGVTSSIGSFGEAIKKSVPSLYELESKYKSTVENLGASLDTWRELSKTGVNFGNDILAMQTAAKGARMELGDFNEIVTQNRASLAGWGGSIDKGAKDFARVSKQMFDEYTTATDSLRQLGYTNKDLNEVLALQMSAIGTSMADGKAKDEAAIKAATDLATEMDLMAKMTGKTREEQMEAQKKLQMDQAFQAKMALDTQGMDEKQALEYTTKMKEEYAKAEAQGLGQVFKEQFLYGTVVTKEASMQLVSSGKAGLAVSEQAKAASEGNFKLAAEKSKEAYAEAAKMAKDPAALQMRVISGITGDFGAATAKFAKESEALAKGIEGLRKKIEKETGQPVTTEQASEAYRDQARKDQKNVPPTTATVVNVEQRAKDAASAFQSGFVDPLIKQSYPAIEKFNKELVDAKGALTKFIKGAEAAGKGGVNAANSGKALKDVPKEQVITYGLAKGIDEGPNKLAGETRAQYDKRKAVKLAEGGVVESKPGGTPAIIGEGGKTEAVIPLDKLDSMLKSNGKAGNIPGIDLSKIGKDIKTTTSKVEVTNWPIEITELKKLTPVQTQPAAAPAAGAPAPAPGAPAPAEAKKEDKQPQADTAFQEKMLLETRNMNEKDAAEYKKKIAEQYIKAEAAGVGKEFREFIVNGKELSKEAQDKIAAATIQSNKDTAAKSAEAESKKAEAKVEAYTIKAGDNLTKIAKAAGVSIADIMKANPQIKDANKIVAGAKIDIPGIKKEEAKKAADDEAAIAREDLASLEAARAKNQKDQPSDQTVKAKLDAETKGMNEREAAEYKQKAIEKLAKEQKSEPKPAEGTSSESYKINGKEVDKKEFDKHMEANPELAGLMKGIQPRAGGDAATAGGGDSMAAAVENVKSMQEQIGKVNEEAAQQELEKRNKLVQQTRDAINEEVSVKQKAAEDVQNLTKKSEELAKQREGIEERLANRQARAAQLREIAGERDLTAQEKEALKLAENGIRRAENNLKRNLEEQAKLDEALEKAKQESNDKAIKSSEQQTKEAIDKELSVKEKANKDAQDLTKKSEELAEQRGSIEQRLAERQAEVAALRETAGERDLTAQEKADLELAENGVKRAENNLKRNLEDQAELDEALAKAKKESNATEIKTAEQTARDDIDSAMPSSSSVSDDEKMRAIQEQEEKERALAKEKEEKENLDKINEEKGGQMLSEMIPGPKYSEQAATPAAQEPADTLDRSKISFGKISKIDPKTGLPVMVDPKKDEKALPKVENKTQKAEEEKKAADAKKAEEAKHAEEAKKTGDGSKPGEEKTLNDVVKTLEKLNTAMEKLIAVNNANTSLMRDQIKATKTSGTRNLYEAH
jgi:LysM repeat protein